MTKIEELRKLHRDAASTTCGQALSGLLDQLPALLDVAEAAERYIAAVDAEEWQAIALASLRTALARLEGVE